MKHSVPKFIRLVDGRIETAVKTFVKCEVSVKFVGETHHGDKIQNFLVEDGFSIKDEIWVLNRS